MPLTPSDRALGDVLVARGILSLPQLDEAAALAERWDVRLGDAILSRDWIDSTEYYQGIAHHYGLPFVDLIRHPIDSSLLREVDADAYARQLTIPWAKRGDRLIVATAEPGPQTVLFARRMWGAAIEFVVASKFDVIWSVQTAFAEALSHHAVLDLAEQDPQMSARTVMTPSQALIGYGLLSLLLGGLALAPIVTLVALNLVLSVFYLGNFLFRGVLVAAGGGRSTDWNYEVEIAARALSDDELPVFTVLVPMFREGAVLPKLAQSLRRLDYPLGKLDIKIVLEDGDSETIEAARALGLEGVFEVIRVPPSQPQTKPKACNFALRFARGEFVVVYDAEDQPEPDQLRKVVATFLLAPPDVACLQCRLNYFNADENWLSRLFTLDYSLWFDLILPGLERFNIPIPLGGTSNHFKIDVLRELHAWDPFNVTEDADLGVRLYEKGYRVAIVDSTTFEEASCHLGNWIRQRSRWLKGYMQTLLVHTRQPLRLIQLTGLRGFLGFVFFIGGTVLSALFSPIFWLIYLIWLLLLSSGFDAVFPQSLLFISLFNLLIGNGAFIFLHMIAPLRRGWLRLIPFSLTAFAYWALMSIAAYKGLWQLIHRPFFWEKTEHGVSSHVSPLMREAPL
jgi:glycosyltransferase XagB